MDYIIVQAGGKGTRLKHLTKNKPKALVPVENLPMLFHLFGKYPDKRFVIIADYKKEVMHEYLEAFAANVEYQIVDAAGTGTCAGIRQAIDLIPDGEQFMLVWSDLILPEDMKLPDEYEHSDTKAKPQKDYIGVSQTFVCRWSYRDGKFEEESSLEHGVAGFFLFTEKAKIADVPESGELVRWMQERRMAFDEVGLAGTKEFGLIEEYERLEAEKCRPFNCIIIKGDRVIKEGIDAQGKKLGARECAWYEKAKRLGITALPEIYEMNPLEMERISGKNIYEYQPTYGQKQEILLKLTNVLKQLHASEKIPADSFSCRKAYFNKTFERIRKIRDLVPFANERSIVVNGRKCRNVFFHKRELEKRLADLTCDSFCFIHGDCTFSNMMLREDGSPVLIDPRGYFGYTELHGDPLYDWAKLYYSIVGNYDQFNLKRFRLSIGQKSDESVMPELCRDAEKVKNVGNGESQLLYGEVRLEIESNHWEDMESDFFAMTGTKPEEIKLLHAVIWLSLTTYAWQDYDSICGAFYNGLYYLEEVL